MRGAQCEFFDDDPMLIGIPVDEHWLVDIIEQTTFITQICRGGCLGIP